MNEYISIKEFARRAGITPQAVYKQLDNKLKNYCKVVDGKKTLQIKALELFENNNFNQPINNEFSTVVNLLKGQLSEKDKQIEALTKQLEAKDIQIEALNEALSRSQHLQANAERKILAIEAPKRRWWPFGKRKENEDEISI